MPSLGFPFIHPPPTRQKVAELFWKQRSTDRLGLGINEFFALGAVLLAGWPTTWVDWAALPLAVCVLIRLSGHIHVPGPLLWDRSVQLLLVWIAIALGSWFWTAGSSEEWRADIRTLRFAPLLLSLFMVMDRRRMLIAALALGIACGQLSQFAQVIARVCDWPWLIHQRLPGRDSGWWDPVVGGSILCAGLGLHLAPLVRESSARAKALCAAGVISTLVCILLTGTRGAMIGAGLLMAVGLFMLVARAVLRRTGTQRQGFAVAAIACAGAVMLGGLMLPSVQKRIATGRDEVARALTSNDYATDTGARIGAWKWAWEEFRARPVAGVGVGGFHPWATAHAAAHPDLPANTLPHAHSMYAHALATTGALGAIGLMGGLLLAVRSGLRDPDTGAPTTGYDAGPALGLVGLMAAGLFDSIQVNQQTAYVMYVLVALCVSCRPPLTYREAGIATASPYQTPPAA